MRQELTPFMSMSDEKKNFSTFIMMLFTTNGIDFRPWEQVKNSIINLTAAQLRCLREGDIACADFFNICARMVYMQVNAKTDDDADKHFVNFLESLDNLSGENFIKVLDVVDLLTDEAISETGVFS